MVWKSNGDGIRRKYDFSYDAANRLMQGLFEQNDGGSTWGTSLVNYTVKMGDGVTPASAYFSNGNIKLNYIIMKTEIRLNSVVTHGVGGAECGAIDLIYLYLLHEFGQDTYNYIGINQIGSDLDEFVMKEPGNKIHINIRYPVYEDFELKSIDERNRIRLDVVHTALMRIADYDKKLGIVDLIAIREKILNCNFCFDFIYRSHANKKKPSLIGKIAVRPLIDKFEYYVIIEQEKKIQCRQVIFTGITTSYYMDRFFCYGKWKNENEFIVWGKEKIVETHVFIDGCAIEILNLTPYDNPPFYTLMKVGISDEVRRKADDDWHHAIPPAHAAIIRQSSGNASN